jgi:ribonuclease HI
MQLSTYTDGGSKGNPGPTSIGVVIYNGSREGNPGTKCLENELVRYREDIGIGTNNEAEYAALIRALEIAAGKLPEVFEVRPGEITQIDCYADSELMIKQLNGLYKIKNATIRDNVFKIRILESELRIPVHYHHIRREQNVLADALVNDDA